MSAIKFVMGVAVRAPIEPGQYTVGKTTIQVSYPERLVVQPYPALLPKSLCTQFVVEWTSESDAARLRSKTFERTLPVHKALTAISEILAAFKLVRIGHADGIGIRTIGVGDTLYYATFVDGAQIGVNTGLKDYAGNNAWEGSPAPADPHGTTALATPHIGSPTQPIARRFVRCFELLEHGFYAESFLVAFSVLDDFVQTMLHKLMEDRGLTEEGERELLLRGIKEHRLKLYLGPVVKLLFGKDLKALWPESEKALEWLNTSRNRIAHSAASVDYSKAAVGIFGCLKTIVVLRDAGASAVDIPVELFRHSKLMASWTISPPQWVPAVAIAEAMDFS